MRTGAAHQTRARPAKRQVGWAAALLLAAVAGAASEAGADTAKPLATDDARARCASCHAEIAREWESSAHRRSGTDPAYLTAVAKEPLPFCRACHVPSGDPSRPTPASVAERGIGCVDCHVGVGADHATTKKSTRAAVTCGSCHEFRFPSSPGLMQRTVTEHAASAFAKSSCESCHMPSATTTTRPHKDHRFLVDDAMLARALVASASRAGPSRVALRIRPGDVGHAMPTGDLFRRLAVRVAAHEGEQEVASATRFLSRKFRTERVGDGVFAKVDAKDDRVGAGLEPCFELDVGPRGVGRNLAITISYQRVQEPRTANENDVVLNGSTVLWSTSLPANQEISNPCR